jgi:hypothetical protein
MQSEADDRQVDVFWMKAETPEGERTLFTR